MAIGAIVGAGKRLAKKVATKAKAAKDTPKQAAARATRQRSVDRMDAHERGAPRRAPAREPVSQRDPRLLRAEIDEGAKNFRADAAQAARGGSSRARKVGTAVGGAGVAAGAVAADRDKKRRGGR